MVTIDDVKTDFDYYGIKIYKIKCQKTKGDEFIKIECGCVNTPIMNLISEMGYANVYPIENGLRIVIIKNEVD